MLFIFPKYLLLIFLFIALFWALIRLTNHCFVVFSLDFLAPVLLFILLDSISVFLGILRVLIAKMAHDLSHALLIVFVHRVYSISRFLWVCLWAKHGNNGFTTSVHELRRGIDGWGRCQVPSPFGKRMWPELFHPYGSRVEAHGMQWGVGVWWIAINWGVMDINMILVPELLTKSWMLIS